MAFPALSAGRQTHSIHGSHQKNRGTSRGAATSRLHTTTRRQITPLFSLFSRLLPVQSPFHVFPKLGVHVEVLDLTAGTWGCTGRREGTGLHIPPRRHATRGFRPAVTPGRNNTGDSGGMTTRARFTVWTTALTGRPHSSAAQGLRGTSVWGYNGERWGVGQQCQ
jgi:hypothetical protein